MGREPENSGVHERPRNQEQRRAAGVFQRPRPKAGGQARKNCCRLGRSAGAGRAEGHRDSVLARASVARAGGKAGFPRNPFERLLFGSWMARGAALRGPRSEEHTSELQSQSNLVCRLLLEKKKTRQKQRSLHTVSDSTLH